MRSVLGLVSDAMHGTERDRAQSGRNEGYVMNTQELLKYAKMSDAERAAVIDSGAFNAFIRAYCAIAMRRAGLTDDAIRQTDDEMQMLFDDLRALDAVRQWAQIDN